MTSLPPGWKQQTLGDVLTFKYGKNLPRHSREDGSIPVYGSNGRVGSHSIPLVNGPAIIIGRKGSIGEVHFSTDACWPIDTTYFVDEFGDHFSEFWFWYLRHLSLGQLDRATAIPGLNREDAYKLPVTFPKRSEQHRIVAILQSLFRRSKSVHDELLRVPRLIKRYKQAALAAAFRGDITTDWRLRNGVSLNNDWGATTLGSLSTEVRYGTAAKCHYEPKATPVLRIPNVAEGRIDTSDLKYGSFTDAEIRRLALREGDLLVIRSNGSLGLVGRAALVTKGVEGYLYAGYLIRLRLDCELADPAFVRLAFEEPSIRQRIETLAKSTSGVNNINGEQLRTLSLPRPPLLEQREIVRRIDTAFARVDRTAAEAARATGLVDRLDQAILAKAFRGELVPSDIGPSSSDSEEDAREQLPRSACGRVAAASGESA